MATARRLGARDSETRSKLLDAAERLLMTEGHGAVTSRRVGQQAGIAGQLVHYYFRTMDDLFLEVIRRRSEAGLEAFAAAIDRGVTLRMLWELNSNQPNNPMSTELIALAGHHEAIRAEIASFGQRFRQMNVDAVATILEAKQASADRYPPEVITIAITGIGQFLTMESAIGMSSGHAAMKDYVERLITELEGPG